MDSSKKILLTTIGIAILVVFVTGVTFAFFNYTRIGASNTIKVGRISFVTRQTSTINLTNLFPIDPTEQGIMDDETKVGTLEITIEGDTDYENGIEYLVSSVDTNIYTSEGQVVPISLDITVDGLGTENANYFTARESANTSIYKQLVGETLVGDGMLLVGYIKPNTTSGTAEGVDGSITMKAYLDKNKILVSDTYDGTESGYMGTPNSLAQGKTVLTTNEWNALESSELSFKVKVEANEGIWVNPPLEEIMKQENFDTTKNRGILDNEQSEFVTASTGIDFGNISSDTNGKGIYMRTGTENDIHPIIYYRGAVEDNNIIFNNLCWKAVRTTDTGGVKLIYNGETSYNERALERSEYGELVTNTGNYTFDETDKSWHATLIESLSYDDPIEMSFNLPAGNYSFEISGTLSSEIDAWAELDIIINDELIDYGYGYDSETITGFGAINVSSGTDIVSLEFYGEGSTNINPSNVIVKILKEDDRYGKRCNNIEADAHINISGTTSFRFNTNYSIAYVGYMYGNVYTYNQEEETSGAYFGNSFTYDGTNYTLVDPVATKNNTHHYTCNLTTAAGTCTTIRYYYYGNYYLNLTGGDSIESAIEKMQTNTNDSNAKNKIDTWYASHMTGVTNKLEDTIWCNDRSFGDNNNNGWIANGGDLNTPLYYGAYQRSYYASNTSTVKHHPSLACTSKNDAFTVSNKNGNQKLTYPVALLTSDELVLAGGVAGNESSFYLSNGDAYYWTMSPFDLYNGIYDNVFSIGYDGFLNNSYVHYSSGLRPSISIKPGLPVISGTGTANDPYVIE